MSGETYAAAGVSIAAGDDAVRRIGPAVRSTHRPGVIGDIGGFGGLFDTAAAGYTDPVLVSSTDGVGTKALVAAAAGRYDTVGVDLVAMCVDDLVCQGAEPLFLLDYISVGRVDPDMIEALVTGVAEGCRVAGCALIGGEIAEHPGVMAPGEFDLVGFAVGAVERGRLQRARPAPGDVLVGLGSPNLRSNGFSLARRVLFDVAGRGMSDVAYEGAAATLEAVLLEPSVIYAPSVVALHDSVDVGAAAHVTGGGIVGNLPRVLPDDVDAVVETGAWQVPPIFGEIQRLGAIDRDEMFRVFNMGIGLVVTVSVADRDRAVEVLADHGHDVSVIGELVPGDGRVRLR